MSLLLDALKKAADDKEKSSRGDTVATKGQSYEIDNGHDALPVSSIRKAGVNDKPAQKSQSAETADQESISSDDEPFSAGELTLDLDESPEQKAEIESELETEPEGLSLEPSPGESGNTVTEDDHQYAPAGRQTTATSHHISSDALSLLIDKTNAEVRKGKMAVTASVVIATIVVLLSGGAYFYTDMQDEIAAIERKHRITMQAMQAKTKQEKTPEKSAIIKNLVSDAELEDKVEYAKAQMEAQAHSAPAAKTVPVEKKSMTASSELSIKRTNKVDPVAEKLDDAWLAYDEGRYEDAETYYTHVLELEADNRDALLGIGAISVIRKDEARARQIYQSLLRQDPRDPIATAALSSLGSDASTLETDNKYLMSMLEKNPDAPYLNFSLANNFAQQNKWKSAQQYYFKAWQHDSDNADYLFNLAVSMDQLDKPEQALGFYRDSLDKARDRQVSFSREAVQKRIAELASF